MIISKATPALSWITKAIFFGWKIQVRDNDRERCGCFASVEGQFLATDVKFTLGEQRLSGCPNCGCDKQKPCQAGEVRKISGKPLSPDQGDSYTVKSKP